MKRLLAMVAVLFALVIASVAVAWLNGAVTLPFGPSHRELEAQLRDRGPVAVAGAVPLGLRTDDPPLRPAARDPLLAAALAGTRTGDVARALTAGHYDGLLVRTDRPLGAAGSALRALAIMHAAQGLTGTYLDDTAALYEPAEAPAVDPADAPRLIEVVRLILEGAAPPPERLFSDAVRRPKPAEVAVIIRDGRDPILWRAVRGGSLARALVDATYAALDRWSTRQQQHYGPLREAIQRLPLTVAIFHDRGTLGARTPEFLDRAADPRVFAIGYEDRGRWEYVLPPSPFGPAPRPSRAIAELAREHDVPPPGYLRPELTLYRFRALSLVEREPQGAVEVFDPK